MVLIILNCHRYPPFWLPTEVLWGGLNTLDTAAKASRGVYVASAISDPGRE